MASRRRALRRVSTMPPSTIGGQTNLQLSSRLANRQGRCHHSTRSSGSPLSCCGIRTNYRERITLQHLFRLRRQAIEAVAHADRTTGQINIRAGRQLRSRRHLQYREDTPQGPLVDKGIHAQSHAVRQSISITPGRSSSPAAVRPSSDGVVAATGPGAAVNAGPHPRPPEHADRDELRRVG